MASLDIEEPREEEAADSLVKLQRKLINLITQLDKEARKVSKIIADNPNSKRDIKESSLATRSLLSQMTTTTTMNMLKTRRLDKTDDTASVGIVQMEDTSCQVEEAAMKQTQEMATQTDDTSWHKNTKVTKERIRAVDTLEDFQRVKNLTWSVQLMLRTFVN